MKVPGRQAGQAGEALTLPGQDTPRTWARAFTSGGGVL